MSKKCFLPSPVGHTVGAHEWNSGGNDTFSPARKYPKSRRGPPVWTRCSALPAADEAEHKRVQRSVCNEAALAARRAQGTANGLLGPPRRPKRKADQVFGIRVFSRFPLWNSLCWVGREKNVENLRLLLPLTRKTSGFLSTSNPPLLFAAKGELCVLLFKCPGCG